MENQNVNEQAILFKNLMEDYVYEGDETNEDIIRIHERIAKLIRKYDDLVWLWKTGANPRDVESKLHRARILKTYPEESRKFDGKASAFDLYFNHGFDAGMLACANLLQSYVSDPINVKEVGLIISRNQQISVAEQNFPDYEPQ